MMVIGEDDNENVNGDNHDEKMSLMTVEMIQMTMIMMKMTMMKMAMLLSMTCQGPMSRLDATPPGEDKAEIGSWWATYILIIIIVFQACSFSFSDIFLAKLLHLFFSHNMFQRLASCSCGGFSPHLEAGAQRSSYL